MRQVSMRSPYILFLCSVLVLAAGCSAPLTITYPGSGPQPAPPTVAPAAQVATQADALNVARDILDKNGTRWLQPPTARVVEQITYAEARRRIQPMNQDDNPAFPLDTPLWLVVFEGRWRLLPYGQTQGEPAPQLYEGCGFVLFKAQDGALIAMGDTLCPGRP